MMLAVGVIVVDVCVSRKRIDTISAVYFGLLVGVLLTGIASNARTPLLYLGVIKKYRSTIREFKFPDLSYVGFLGLHSH